jgi:uncharacterized membrane protein YqaE (UPF0057 family)
MRYIFAFLIPPLSVALCKRWGHFTFNLILWLVSMPAILFVGIGLIGWLICIIHALAVCRMSSIDKRVNRLVEAVQAAQSPTNIR